MAMKNLATAAVVAVCIALYFASVTASPLKESAAENNAKQQRNQVIASSITAANQAHDVDFRLKRQSSRRHGSRQEEAKKIQGDCTESEMNQNCTPSAHLVGYGMKWDNKITDIALNDLYSSNWICKDTDAFVDCGMHFIYSDQKLYVPVCGVYEIYSQVLFQPKSDDLPSTAANVHHRVAINRSCDSSSDNTADFKSYAGMASKVTTTNLATVKMCEGGSVSVIIPAEDDSTCCPYGGKSSTYFSVQLVSEVSCDNIE